MESTHTRRLQILTCALGAAGVLVIAGCSDSDGNTGVNQMPHHMGQMPNSAAAPSSTATASAQFNHADVMFAEMMYPHHAQAVEMSELVDARTANPQIRALVATIKAEQVPEMQQMSQWLHEWGRPAPHTKSGDMGNMGNSMNGMLSQQDMDELASKRDTDFDRTWLTMMIAHHEGAIDMANSEIAQGLNPAAKTMATSIITTQTTEIALMTTLLQR